MLLSGRLRRQALIELHLPVEAGGQLRRGKAADGCAVNLPCAKVLPHAKRLYGANAPPARRPVWILFFFGFHYRRKMASTVTRASMTAVRIIEIQMSALPSERI